MATMKTTRMVQGSVTTSNATATLLLELDLDTTATVASFSIVCSAKDATGAEQYHAWKAGVAQRVGAATTIPDTVKDVVAPSLLGFLAGLLSTAGLTVTTSGTKVQFWVTGKASTNLTWRGACRAIFN